MQWRIWLAGLYLASRDSREPEQTCLSQDSGWLLTCQVPHWLAGPVESLQPGAGPRQEEPGVREVEQPGVVTGQHHLAG